jgi:glycosyltransferase involved in cell wall biosynthesis
LTGGVTFPGPLPAAQAFPRGRAIVVPSRAESLPFIVLEAAAAQVPLIAADVGGIPEIVAGSDTPLLPAGDFEALARSLQAFLDDPGTAKARALRLKQTVQKRFAIGATTAAVLDFYAAHGHAANRTLSTSIATCASWASSTTAETIASTASSPAIRV